MKKFVLIVAVAALALVVSSQLVSAGRRGGCGGGRGGNSCGNSCGSSCGGYVGGCASGSCGYTGGCASGSCGNVGGYSGCSTCGTGSYVIGGGAGTYTAAPCATCAGGVCTINPRTGIAITEASESEATIVVSLPEDATLTIDNEPTTSTSANRVFVSPTLESGKEYQYTLKAQVVREGKTQTTTRQVTVQAGQVSRIELTVPATGVAQ